MTEIVFRRGDVSNAEQEVITQGFSRHSEGSAAPLYKKERLTWCAYAPDEILVGAVTTDLLWDWIYVDELWVDESQRGTGLGRRLVAEVERYAAENLLSGVWLWTQSWQAEDFYRHVGYEEFARFPSFPKGHSRIGFRKFISILGE